MSGLTLPEGLNGLDLSRNQIMDMSEQQLIRALKQDERRRPSAADPTASKSHEASV